MLLLTGVCKVKLVEEVMHSEGGINLEKRALHATKAHWADTTNVSKRKSQGQLSESSHKPKKP